jgi:hypothetical protein
MPFISKIICLQNVLKVSGMASWQQIIAKDSFTKVIFIGKNLSKKQICWQNVLTLAL